MNIASLLAKKGPKVVTVQPEQTIRQALALLAEHNIGALVVVDERLQERVGRGHLHHEAEAGEHQHDERQP